MTNGLTVAATDTDSHLFGQLEQSPRHYTTEQFTEIARHLFYQAIQTPIALQEGREWYFNIHRIAAHMAKSYSLPLPLVSSVMALCSQNQYWSTALVLAERCCQELRSNHGRSSIGMLRTSIPNLNTDQLSKLIKLAVYSDDFEQQKLILNGPKLSAFAENILHPSKEDSVTIDVHIARAFGVTSRKLKGKYGQETTVYERIAEAIRIVAEEVDYLPSEVQACIWCDIRGSHE